MTTAIYTLINVKTQVNYLTIGQLCGQMYQPLFFFYISYVFIMYMFNYLLEGKCSPSYLTCINSWKHMVRYQVICIHSVD